MNDKLTIHLIEDLAPVSLHRALWQNTVNGAHWEYGNASGAGPSIPFWYMDLGESECTTALWHHAKARCESHLGCNLRVLRQYANGHTYGQGGRVHLDDHWPGTYTLLYYPMLEWQSDWEGETVFQNNQDEVVAAIRPAPNRAILFDSRIPHVGRAPGRACTALRVTVAFKLKGNPVPNANTVSA